MSNLRALKCAVKGTPEGGVNGGSLPGKRMKQLRSPTSCFSLKRAIKELFVKVEGSGEVPSPANDEH
jgi:hypothetical protein